MTEEERREMLRNNYAAQLAAMGYSPDGNPLPVIACTPEEHAERHGLRPHTPEAQGMELAQNVSEFGHYLVQLAQLLQTMTARLDTLEAERAQAVTVRHAEVNALNFRIREKAAQLGEKYGLAGAPALRRIRADIRKNILKAYGIKDFHDLPAVALAGAMGRIDKYANIRLMMEIKKSGAG